MIGVTQDYSKAAHYYELAAEQGHSEAQYELARQYEVGLGVTQNHSRATHYFELSASQEHSEAHYGIPPHITIDYLKNNM